MSGDEFAGLPFLAIEPAEKLFELMCDQNLHGKTFRSSLFDRAIRIEFGLDPEFEENFGDEIECSMVWAKISSPDPMCAPIEIGIDANENWIGQDTHYFDAGKMCFKSDDYPWSGMPREHLLQVILEYTQDTIQYGLFELWRGSLNDEDTEDTHECICGPLRSHDRSRGWLRRAIEKEEHQLSENASSSVWPIWSFIGAVLAPFTLPVFSLLGIPSKVWRGNLHGRRYPPYPEV